MFFIRFGLTAAWYDLIFLDNNSPFLSIMSLLCEENNLEDLLLLKISILLNETCIILIPKIVISEKNSKSFFIPRGFAHGFLGLDKENIVHYSCSNYRDPKSEVSIKWNDIDLKINWGIKNPIISKKDKFALSLKDFKKK